MATPYPSICTTCKHLLDDGAKCKAYPDGIPASFWDGSKKHRKVTGKEAVKVAYTPLFSE